MISIQGEPIAVDIRTCEIWGDGRRNDLMRTHDGRFAFGRWDRRKLRYAVNPSNGYRLWEAVRRDVIAWCNVAGYNYPDGFMPHPQHWPNREPAPSPIAAPAAAEQPTKRDKVFVSYSDKDKRFLDACLAHLKPLERAGRVSAWSDKQIEPGSRWFAEIQTALASTKVAVLLVTKDFLASDFIHDHELGPLLKEAETGGVAIRWVLVRNCNWKKTPLKDYQAAYPTDMPLAEMKARRDSAWVIICEAIEAAANLG